MNCYLITYDLSAPGRNYDNLLKRIVAYKYYTRVTESCYAVQSARTAREIYADLAQALDKNDTIYVLALSRDWAGRGPEEVNNWLSNALR